MKGQRKIKYYLFTVELDAQFINEGFNISGFQWGQFRFKQKHKPAERVVLTGSSVSESCMSFIPTGTTSVGEPV